MDVTLDRDMAWLSTSMYEGLTLAEAGGVSCQACMCKSSGLSFARLYSLTFSVVAETCQRLKAVHARFTLVSVNASDTRAQLMSEGENSSCSQAGSRCNTDISDIHYDVMSAKNLYLMAYLFSSSW